MLYDILFIDDDFGKRSEGDWDIDARKLFLDLVKDNLQVTYTTGEYEDLERLKSKDLSCIEYIFCDLHLLTTDKNSLNPKTIASKLVGIFNKLIPQIKSVKITVFINSKYEDDWKKVENPLKKGVSGIRPELNLDFQLIDEKNKLEVEQKQKLLEKNLNRYIKSLIITKALEVERLFDKKVPIASNRRDVITFKNKYKRFRECFSKLKSSDNKQIQLLQQIRNKVAHTDNDFCGIKDMGIKKAFWEILEENGKTEKIKFKNFEDLMKYIKSIDDLKEIINKTQRKN